AGLGLAGFLLWHGTLDHRLLVIGVVLLWVQGWYELNLELARSRLEPLRYGRISMFKSVLALGIGFMLVLLGMGALAPLLGLLTGMVLASLLLAWREWQVLSRDAADRSLLLQLLRYGLPMTATYALSFLVSSSDRFLLGWFLGAEAPGLYAPGYDLAQFSLIMLMTIINLASYPMVVRALDGEGRAAARRQLEKVLVLLVAAALPAAVGMAVCSGNIATVMLGETYRESATMLIPLIALSSFIFGMKIFYLDLGFQLSKKTYLEPRVMVWAALANLLLNLWWIPLYGLAGAASATVVAYCLGAYLSWRLGRKVFALPSPPEDVWKILFACGVMALALWAVADFRGGVALMGQIALGATVYAATMLLLDAAGIRRMVQARLVP
ncbi:MAG TPA: polysaccharide biosynthesis protein, partial [Gammaproteobacteria bacterium]|nr:polysaccharide biosynthesis protein [Gammaproteobacteria bacterium]